MESHQPLRIGIVGAGFTGTALAALFHRHSARPITLYLFEKTGEFAAGSAYRTPFPHHLLNACASDMSAFEDDPLHFTNWLLHSSHASPYFDQSTPIDSQFVPRFLYRDYLRDLLKTVETTPSQVKLHLETADIISAHLEANDLHLVRADGTSQVVDQLILAMGHEPPKAFPFPVSPAIHQVNNPWDYEAIKSIPNQASVMIVGTGLSMMDVVLTLHDQGHSGQIRAISRHGLMPLPHAGKTQMANVEALSLPGTLRSMMRWTRQHAHSENHDWRGMMNALRQSMSSLWQRASIADKGRFLRHVLPYWNIHRHRVHPSIAQVIQRLIEKKQLSVMAGKILSATETSVMVSHRHSHAVQSYQAEWLINCMGPAQSASLQSPLMAGLLRDGLAKTDELRAGVSVNEVGALIAHPSISSRIYTLGPLVQGQYFESLAVPEIRVQCKQLVSYLLGKVCQGACHAEDAKSYADAASGVRS